MHISLGSAQRLIKTGIFCSAALAHPAELAKLYAVINLRLIRVQELQVPSLLSDFRPRPVAIGSLTLPNLVILAPMSGVTDAPFRRCVMRLGAGLVISEMTAS